MTNRQWIKKIYKLKNLKDSYSVQNEKENQITKSISFDHLSSSHYILLEPGNDHKTIHKFLVIKGRGE